MLSLQAKVKERDIEISKLQESLHFHTEGNRELKEHLDAALNEETLQQIEQRISKYKKERDSVKENMKLLKASQEQKLYDMRSQYEGEMSDLREELEQREEELKSLKSKADKYKTKCHELKKELKERMTTEYLIPNLEMTQQQGEEYSHEEHYIPHPSLIGSTQSLPAIRDPKQTLPSSTTPIRYTSTSLLMTETEPHLPLTRELVEREKTSKSTNYHHITNDITTSTTSLKHFPSSPSSSFSSSSSTPRVSVCTANGDKIRNIKSVISEGGVRGEELRIGSRVVVKRKEGLYYSGLLRYVGITEKGEELCGVELEVQSMSNICHVYMYSETCL